MNVLKIRIVKKAQRKSGSVCPWLVDYPSEAPTS
jgi:hypothetical protein